MSEIKRVFLIVLDSFGVGETPDSAEFGDAGANTLRSCFETGRLSVPNMQKLGLFNIDGVTVGSQVANPTGAYLRITESTAARTLQPATGRLPELYPKSHFRPFRTGYPRRS